MAKQGFPRITRLVGLQWEDAADGLGGTVRVERAEPVGHDSILQVVEILPLALSQLQDMFGKGARFIVGTVSVKSAGPISIYGVKQVEGEDLLQCLYD